MLWFRDGGSGVVKVDRVIPAFWRWYHATTADEVVNRKPGFIYPSSPRERLQGVISHWESLAIACLLGEERVTVLIDAPREPGEVNIAFGELEI
ncbi:MAG TPA: hypothetical protein VEI97_19625 [bacterium]|nr:hypothetical protein [bacterium]